MDQMLDLWLPIVLSAASVWFLSALFWMALPLHHKDHRSLPDENGFIARLKEMGIAPGSYGFPNCATKEQQRDPERMRMWKEGPAGFMTIMGPMSMGRNLLLSFLLYLVVSVFVAYLASQSRSPGANFAEVFQVTATAGIMAYLFGWVGGAIWFGMSRNACVAYTIDSVAYGLATGTIFAMLWPGVPAG